MNQEKNLSFEEIESHLDKANIEQYSSASRAKSGDKAIGLPANFCGIYQGVKPILRAILIIPLIPPKIKRAIEIFIQAADAICPI